MAAGLTKTQQSIHGVIPVDRPDNPRKMLNYSTIIRNGPDILVKHLVYRQKLPEEEQFL